jgi:hypothetical protein
LSGAEGKPPVPKSAAEQAATAVGEDAPPPGMSDGAASASAQAAKDRVATSPQHPPRRRGDLKSEEVLDKQVISDTALIAITTGVTVNVLAAFLGVIRGLFPTDQSHKPETTEDTDKDKK